jgi:hypothetical protein
MISLDHSTLVPTPSRVFFPDEKHAEVLDLRPHNRICTQTSSGQGPRRREAPTRSAGDVPRAAVLRRRFASACSRTRVRMRTSHRTPSGFPSRPPNPGPPSRHSHRRVHTRGRRPPPSSTHSIDGSCRSWGGAWWPVL